MLQTQPCTLAAWDAAIETELFLVVEGANEEAGCRFALGYRFGQLSGWLDGNGISRDDPVQFAATELEFHLPDSFYHQIPNQSQGLLHLTLYTYCDGALVGQPQTTTVAAYADPARCAPRIIGWDIQDVNPVSLALTGESYDLLRDLSTARVAVSAQAQAGASVSQVRINGELGPEVEFIRVDRKDFLVEVTDSRGITTRTTLTAPLTDYRQPTNRTNITAITPEGTAELTLYGRWYIGDVLGRQTALELRCQVGDGPWQTLTPALSGDSFSASVSLEGLDYTQNLTVQTQVFDGLVTVSQTVVARGNRPVFDWSGEDFRVQVPANIAGAHIRSVYLQGQNTLTLATRGNGRQVYFLLGTCNWLGRVTGLLWVRADKAQAVWEGNPEVTVQSQSAETLPDGNCRVTVTLSLPVEGWDDVVILSNKPIDIL